MHDHANKYIVCLQTLDPNKGAGIYPLTPPGGLFNLNHLEVARTFLNNPSDSDIYNFLTRRIGSQIHPQFFHLNQSRSNEVQRCYIIKRSFFTLFSRSNKLHSMRIFPCIFQL